MTDDGTSGRETKVLAIASHVAYGYVGNTMATFVMQALGLEVAAINTVHYSNHAGYRQLRGTKTAPEDIAAIYQGLVEAGLDDFDMMLTGYVPTAAGLEEIGRIGADLKRRRKRFFWVLDPVMGDQGRLYVAEEEVPVYRSLLCQADLVLPNQFELELLSGVRTDSMGAIREAVGRLHREHQVPNVVVTSVSLAGAEASSTPTLTVVGSTRWRDPARAGCRMFAIRVPAVPVFFSGTGDMFAALTVARLREAAAAAAGPDDDLLGQPGWVPADGTGPTELPLAVAVGRVLASMQAVLADTKRAMDRELAGSGAGAGGGGPEEHLARTKASEVRVVQNVDALVRPAGPAELAGRAEQAGGRGLFEILDFDQVVEAGWAD